MTIKEKVLQVLEQRKGRTVSGAQLATELSVTRNAVWKAVKALKEQGYPISATTNRGYCLSEESSILSAQSIEKYLSSEAKRFQLQVYDEVDSTNTLLKELAAKGQPDGTVVIARRQTAGRGRLGRSFYSPEDTGIYMSILLRPDLYLEQALFLTTSAAVAVAEAIEHVTGKPATIKWVNDVFCDEKKVCGILTEASSDFETGKLEYAVVGIGVNVLPPKDGFPTELSEIAAPVAVAGRILDVTSKLAAEILNRVVYYLQRPGQQEFLEAYRERCFLIGKEVEILPRLQEEEAQRAHVLGIDDQVGLIVRLADHTERILRTGEVRICLPRKGDHL